MKDDMSKWEMLQTFFVYLGKYSWECMKSAVQCMIGLFILASMASMFISHPIFMILVVALGYIIGYNYYVNKD